MDTKRLRYFLCVVDEGSMSKAAARLGLAQPAISQQMQVLETEMSATLLVRSPTGVTPTREGLILYSRASQLVNDLERTRAEIAAPSAAAPTVATIGFAQSAGWRIGPPLLTTLIKDHPSIRLRILEAGSMTLLDHLRHGVCELAVLPRFLGMPGLRTELLYREDLVLFAPAAWALPDRTGFDAVAGLPLVMATSPHATRSIVEAQFAQSGRAPDIVAEVDSLGTVRQIVRDGLAATILPASAISEHPAISRTSLEPALRRPMFIYWQDTRPDLGMIAGMIRDIAGEDGA
ncbi:LysR family transcriptional regulator [Rhodobacterales bacterium HKCCE2091]|nr:LysR family transcriptional regulator [Rhodobacterales bacterium HKCCE2091]